jgi:hypothetical protein
MKVVSSLARSKVAAGWFLLSFDFRTITLAFVIVSPPHRRLAPCRLRPGEDFGISHDPSDMRPTARDLGPSRGDYPP